MIFYCNYGRMLYRFRNKARYWSKTPTFYTPLYLTCTVPCKLCMLCNRQKYSRPTFVIFDPTQPNPWKTAKSRPNPTQPNPRVDPTHGQLTPDPNRPAYGSKKGVSYDLGEFCPGRVVWSPLRNVVTTRVGLYYVGPFRIKRANFFLLAVLSTSI